MLKLIAVILMTLDHIGHYFSAQLFQGSQDHLYLLLRFLGRLAFPIFAFYVAKGYRRTRNIFIYGLRLFAFAVISETILVQAASYINANLERSTSQAIIETHPNVLFTLALGVVAITAWEMLVRSSKDVLVKMEPVQDTATGSSPWHFRFNPGISMDPLLGRIIGSVFLFLSCALALHFDTDYDVYGVLTILIFHTALDKAESEQMNTALLRFSLLNLFFICGSNTLVSYRMISPDHFNWSTLQGFAVLSVPLMFLIKEPRKKPGPVQKYFFYLYYPLHIVLLMYLSRKSLF